MIHSLDLVFLTKLEKALSERQAELAEALTRGRVEDWADYRYRVGQFKGLADALTWAREVQTELVGSVRKTGERT